MTVAISLAGIASALPQRVVTNEFFGDGVRTTNKMFLGTKERRHVARDETSLDLFERAARQLAAEQGFDLETDVDAILTNVALPDLPFTGCGAMLAQRLGAKPKQVLDMHNGGCVAFILLADMARTLVAMHGYRRVLVCVAQTAAGRIFSHDRIRTKPQSAIPGDGASVALFTPSTGTTEDSIMSPIVQSCHPEFASDMTISFDDDHKYWEPSTEPGYLDFPESKITTIIMRGNRLVPAIMRETVAQAGLKPRDIDGLITNQPNPFFLRNWRESMEIPAERHFDTFAKYGNLFQAGIPITLDEAVRDGRIKAGQRILLAGFSHAGDFSAGAILTWKTA